MNDQKETLLNESRNKFMGLGSYLESELKKLYDDGVLTKTDWMKLVEDSKLSGQAVVNAINKTDYPPEMQKELVKNLIAQYEVSIEQTLLDAKYRRYAPERIEEKLGLYEKPVLTNWENAFRAKIISQRQYQDVLNRVKTGHKDIINGIRSIPSKHPKKGEMIESWLEEYRIQMEKLAITPAPQLSYAPSKEVLPEHPKNPNPPTTSQSAKPEPKVEKQKTVDTDLSHKADEGFVDKFISWIWK